MSQVEILQRRKKRQQSNIPLFKPKIEESEEQFTTSDENQSERKTKEVYSVYGIREETDKARLQREMQRDLMQQDLERMREDNYNKRLALYNQRPSEISNMIKAMIADSTFKFGKGQHTTKRHRKIAYGLYHRDTEETTTIELRRGAEQE